MRLVIRGNRQRYARRECDRFGRRDDRRILAEAERPAHDFVEVAHGEEDSRATVRKGLNTLPRLPLPTRCRCCDARVEFDRDLDGPATRFDKSRDVVRSVLGRNRAHGIVRARSFGNRMESIEGECTPILHAAIVGDEVEVSRA